MGYTRQVWTNSPSTASPLSAARLNIAEGGIGDASDRLDDTEGRLDTIEANPIVTAAVDTTGAQVGQIVAVAEVSDSDPSGFALAFAPYVLLDGAGDGTTDDTTSINSQLAAAPAGSVVKGVPGKNYLISGPIVLRPGGDMTLDMTGCTVTLAAGSNSNMLQNAAVTATTTRDADIEIRGGTWVRGANEGTGTGLHSLMFRRVDRLRIVGPSVESAGGKYAICLGAVTEFEVDSPRFATASDGVHINGPARGGRVHGVRGTTGDDAVAITANDYIAYADVVGDVTDVHIWDVNATADANVVKVLAGTGTHVGDITVERVRGTAVLHGVWLGDDIGQAATSGGTYGRLAVRDVEVTSTTTVTAAVRCKMPTTERLHITGVRLDAGTARDAVFLDVNTGATIDRVSVADIVVRGSSRNGIYVQGQTGSLISTLDVISPVFRGVGGTNTLVNAVASTTITAVVVTDPFLTADDTSTTNWLSTSSAVTLGSVAVRGGYVYRGRCLLQLNKTTTVALGGGLRVHAGNRLANLYNADYTIILGDVVVDTLMLEAVRLNTATGVTVLGSSTTRLVATGLISRSGTPPVRVTGGLPVDTAILTPLEGDSVMATSVNSPQGSGPCFYSGGAWRNYITEGDVDREVDRLATLGRAHAAGSVALSSVAYSDGEDFIEKWAGYTAWSSVTAQQISGGKSYSANQAAASGMNHAFPMAAGEPFRAVFKVSAVTGLSSGGVIVGVSSDTPGGAHVTGASSTTRGIYFRNDVTAFDKGTITVLGDPTLTTSEWTVTVARDDQYLTITARRSDGEREEHVRWPVSDGYTVNNLTVFNSDSRQLTGHGVGLVWAKTTIATVRPETGVEDVPTVIWTGEGNNGAWIALPPGYDSRVPAPVVIAFHGNGSDEVHWGTNFNGKSVAKAFLSAGYIVIGAAYNPNLSTWGSEASLDAYVAAYDYARARFALGPVVVYANSMGGVESLVALAQRRIPNVVAWVGTVPTANLGWYWLNDTTRREQIRTAYGIAADGSDYATKTAGHDPALLPGYAFRGLPMWALIATDDAEVLPGNHFTLLTPRVEPYAAEVVRVETTGGHSTPFAPFTAQMVAFANKYAR